MKQRLLSHRQRIETCLSGDKPDRPPVALWRHFPVDDQTADGLAAAVIGFQRTYDFDLVKVTPASSFCLLDWGVKDDWNGATEGTRDYQKPIIQHPDDWPRLPILDPHNGNLNAQLDCLKLLVGELGPDVPIIQTIFNPLSQAKNLTGHKRLLVHMRRYPDALLCGLKIIAESTIRFIEATREIGIAGVFLAVQHAQVGLLTMEEYAKFGRQYDLRVLEPAQKFWLNLLHIHGTEIMFDELMDYPVGVVNWHDRETSPTLAKAQKLFPGAVCGGLQRHDTMVLGTPEGVKAEALEALESTKGSRVILGTGCVVPITAPHGNILAARQVVDSYSL